MTTHAMLASLVLLAGAGSPVLDNGRVRLGFDSKTGAIVSIVDKATGRDFAAAKAPGPLYKLVLAEPKCTLTNEKGASVTVRREGRAVVVEAVHQAKPVVRVTCRFTAKPGGPFVVGRIAIRAEAPIVIASVTFPTLSVASPLGTARADDAVLLPYCDGCVVRDPAANRLYRSLPYPGAASMQVMAAYDPTAGVYLASHDAAGYAKKLTARQVGASCRLSLSHMPVRRPCTQWSLPYDVAISSFHGARGPNTTTWEAAADLYRSWAKRQPWCKRTLAQRVADGDVPRWLTEPSLFYAFSLRGRAQDNKPKEFNRLPHVVEQAEAWRRVLDAPVTFMLMAWEKRGRWVTPDYFPPYGGQEAFTGVTRELHARGHRTLVFLSGLKWTLHKTLYNNPIDQQAEFDRRGRAHAVSDAKGQAIVSGKPDKGTGRSAEICVGTPLAREILLNASLGCQALGIDCVQADQIVGGGQKPCCHPEHAHPPGGGNWLARRLYDVFAEIRRQGKQRDPAFAFAIEEPGEFYIPVLDTYHARDYQQGRWPRYGRGTVGVPLFTHVYHDFMHGYGGDSCAVTDRAGPTALYQQGMNLVCGKTPAVAAWTRWYDPERTHAFQQRMLRSHVALWRGPAREFLVFGRRVAAEPLDVPTEPLVFHDWRAKKKQTLHVPSVLHSQWRLPDRRQATVFAAIADKPVTFRHKGKAITLEPGQAVCRMK